MQEYMGKTWDGPMSREDKEWLRTWDQYGLIRANEEEYSGGATTEAPAGDDPTVRSALDASATMRDEITPDEDSEIDDDYEEWSKSELETEVTKRNTENPDSPVEVNGTGKNGAILKEDLIKALRLWDQEHPEA